MKKILVLLLIFILLFSFVGNCYGVFEKITTTTKIHIIDKDTFGVKEKGDGTKEGLLGGFLNYMDKIVPLIAVLALVVGAGFIAFGHNAGKGRMINAVVGVILLAALMSLGGSLYNMLAKNISDKIEFISTSNINAPK